MKINITIQNLKPLDEFMEEVEQLFKLNKIRLKHALNLNLNYGLPYYGEFWDLKPNTINVNPTKTFRRRYGLKMKNVLWHELSHCLDFKFNMLSEYEKQFPKKKDHFYISKYAKTNRCEELAEMMVCYITIPYMLKLIAPKHFNFISSYFKSHIPCTEKDFKGVYDGWSEGYKRQMKNKFGFIYDGQTFKVV